MLCPTFLTTGFLQEGAKRLDLSYADAIGYAIAHRRGEDFLTGDRAFAGLKGIRFVG